MTTSFNFKRIIFGGFKLLKIASGSRAFTCSTALLAISTFPFPSASADAAVINSVGVSLLSSVLGHAEDRYDGVIVEASTLPDSKDVFLSDLLYSLQQWKSSGKRGVWLKIPSDKLDYASAAVESGFVMHHAEKDYLMLTHWLSEDENKLPPNASHQIGVGCIVVNDEGSAIHKFLNLSIFAVLIS